MRKKKMHLAQFLMHGPTYHSLAMWRHPRTAAANYDWDRPELYQHLAQVCERGKFDIVFFADVGFIADAYQGTLDAALRYATQCPIHEPTPPPLLAGGSDVKDWAGEHLFDQPSASLLRCSDVGHA